MKKLPLILCGAMAAACAHGAQPMLDLKALPDTVATATVNVIAVTDPGANAYVNGQPQHVYRTGSFGAPVALTPGLNTITVKVERQGAVAERTHDIYRADRAPVAASASAVPADSIYAASFTGVTKPYAFLVYGNGDDRLGGSKMGFIADGIPLSITGENGELYRVQLSAHRYAYVEKIYIDPVAPIELQPVNTSSWSISDQGRCDRIQIALPRRLAYRSYTLLDPNTICVELFGAADNSNWITQHGQLGIIDYAYFEQIDSDVYKIVIRLKQPRCWGYSIDYSGNSLVIDVRHQPASLALRDLVIGLDAGHGGESSGAISPSGIKESHVNLDIVLRLKQLLEAQGATVVLTRDSDISLTMRERKEIWKDAGIDLGISVHNNAGGSPFQPMGTSVYYKHLFDRPLAVCMHSSLLRGGYADYGLTGNFNFSLNGPTDYPNVLVEGLFMSNLAEEEMLADPAERQRLAQLIYQGLVEYLAASRGTLSLRSHCR